MKITDSKNLGAYIKDYNYLYNRKKKPILYECKLLSCMSFVIYSFFGKKR